MDLSTKTKRLPVLCTAGDIAAALNWDVRTVRRHIVPVSEWRAMVDEDPEAYTRKIPGLMLLGQWKIPRAWLSGVFRLADLPAEPQ